MTREGILKHKKVFDAWLLGAKVEARNKLPRPTWFSCENPDFLLGAEYRVKPQPQTRTAWVNIYSDIDMWFYHPSLGKANESAGSSRIACVPVTVTWTEGEGLE